MAMLTGKVVARLPGIFLVSLIYCVPVYLLAWYFELIDGLYGRIMVTLLVTILPVAEVLSPPRPLKSKGELFLGLLILVPATLLATGDKFNVTILAANAAMFLAILPWGWFVWLLTGRSWFLFAGLLFALPVMMVYWITALLKTVEPLELLLVPLLLVLAGGVFWAPAARWIVYVAKRRKDCRISGPGMQAVAMSILFVPVILVLVVFPGMLELSPVWSAVSLTVVGVLLSAVVSEPLRRCLLEWGQLSPLLWRKST